MEKTVFFLNMFPDYEPPEHLINVLSQAAITAADIAPETRFIQMSVSFPAYVPSRLREQVSSAIEAIYKLRSLILVPSFPAAELVNIESEDLLQLFVDENPICRGILAGARWEWEENTLHVHLVANGRSTLETCFPAVTRKLYEQFGTKVTVELHSGEELEGEALFAHMEKLRSALLREVPAHSAPVKKEQPAKK